MKTFSSFSSLLLGLGAMALLVGCAKNPYPRNTLDVVFQNDSSSAIRSVGVEYGGEQFGTNSLAPGEKLKTRFTLREPMVLTFQYVEPKEDRLVRQELPIPARPTDGGEMVFRFNSEQELVRKTRFDLYN
jgi:hypothetical protein